MPWWKHKRKIDWEEVIDGLYKRAEQANSEYARAIASDQKEDAAKRNSEARIYIGFAQALARGLNR